MRAGCGETTLRRWVRAGRISPAPGTRRFRPADVERLHAEEGATVEREDGARAGAVFKALAAGTAPIDIVIQLGIAPRALRSLLVEFQALGGGAYLSRADVEALAAAAPEVRAALQGSGAIGPAILAALHAAEAAASHVPPKVHTREEQRA